jgi:hypothetical protein
LLEEPFFDSETNSFVWLFAGLFDASEILQPSLPINLTLSAHSFFEPLEPSLSPLSSFDQISVAISLPQTEISQEEAKGREGTDSETEKKPSGEEQKVSGREVESEGTGEGSSAREVSGSKVQSAKEAVLKEPNASRKAFEQEIAAKALSNAKKNPKSTAKENGIIITVGAYPEVLPTDGKSTAFIVAKVMDEKGNPLSGRFVNFSTNGGNLLVRQTETDGNGIALSRICSEVLRKGIRKIVTIKAKVNPEAQTQIIIDGNINQVTFSNYSTHISIAWCPNLNAGTEGIVCSQADAVIGGSAQVELHIKQSFVNNFYPYLWVNWVKVIGDGHPRQIGLAHPGREYGTMGVYCLPSFVPGQEVIFTHTVGPEDLEWTRFHHGNVVVTINYTLARYTPPGQPPQMVTEEVSISGVARNAVLKILEDSPPLLAWDPDNPPSEERRRVSFKVESVQSGNFIGVVRIYRANRSNGEGAVKEIWVEGSTNQTISVVWDGTIDGGEGEEWGEGNVVAEKGLYSYDVQFWLPQVLVGMDEDKRVSPYMVIERAVDENGEQVFEAEYYGYDDNGTEGEEDDGHLYFIRWYVLKCGSAQYDNDGDALIDRDGDGWIKEDWVDGRDNDEDGLVDEDPLGWDEDMPDGVDNDGDGRVDEDGPDPVNASQGQVLLYDPDLELVASWDLGSLLCLEHNANDGLVASLEGVRHGVLVRVPVSLMQKAGTYRFVLRVWDNHAHLHKDHQVKPTLEINSEWHKWQITDVGFYYDLNGNGNPYEDSEKLRWDGNDPSNPKPGEFSILRQQPEGNVLYILAHAESPKVPPPDAKVVVWLRTSATDQKGIKVTLRYSGACPRGNNRYHFHKPFGQEIVMVDPPNPSIDDKQIQVHQSPDGVAEVTTYDHATDPSSNYLDSEAIEVGLSGHQKRGRARDDKGRCGR